MKAQKVSRTGFQQKSCPAKKTESPASPIETGGEFLPDGKSISLIQPLESDCLQLVFADGKDAKIAADVEYRRRTYVPPKTASSFREAIIFPSGIRDFGSTIALFTGIKDSLVRRGMPEEVAQSATYFGFGSWFTEVLPAVPFLLISGPRPSAILLLQLLGCLVRHPLPLVEISASSLRAVPMQLRPTLLIDNEFARNPLLRLLSASSNRNANIVRKGGVMNIFSAKALYRGEEPEDDSIGNGALRIDLFPSDRTLPILTLRDRQKLAAEFQPALLAYRVRNIEQVAAAQFDYAGVPQEVRPLAGLLAGCIVGAPELQAGVGPLLQTQHSRFRAERWVEPRCVVIEALLSHCHRKGQDGDLVRVGQIAQDVAAILKGRGETMEIQPRAIGATLRVLGLIAKRDGHGYGFALTESFSRRIHGLARQLDVAGVQEGRRMCSHCGESPLGYGKNDVVNH
jgi:hypothetical protein